MVLDAEGGGLPFLPAIAVRSGKAATIPLSEKQFEILQRITRESTASVCLVQRYRIILLGFEGEWNENIAVEVNLHRKPVGLWRRPAVLLLPTATSDRKHGRKKGVPTERHLPPLALIRVCGTRNVRQCFPGRSLPDLFELSVQQLHVFRKL